MSLSFFSTDEAKPLLPKGPLMVPSGFTGLLCPDSKASKQPSPSESKSNTLGFPSPSASQSRSALDNLTPSIAAYLILVVLAGSFNKPLSAENCKICDDFVAVKST